MKAVNRLFWIVTAAVVLIALGSFSLSFLALKELAQTNGVPSHLSFIWPLIVDVSVIVFTAAILVSQLQKRGAKLAVGLTAFYAVVTIVGNVLHAPVSWLGWFVAILPPLSLIFATEMLRAMSHHIILQHNAVVSLDSLNKELVTKQNGFDTLTGQLDAKQRQVNALAAEIEQLKRDKQTLIFEENTPKVNTLNTARLDAKQQRLNALLTYLDDNPEATLTEAAPVVGVSRQTVGKYVNELSEAGKLHRNGSGWEVLT